MGSNHHRGGLEVLPSKMDEDRGVNGERGEEKKAVTGKEGQVDGQGVY